MHFWNSGKRSLACSLTGVLLVVVLGGCVVYPGALPPIERSDLITPLEITYDVPTQPEDQQEVTVKVGEIRKALIVAELYEDAVRNQNEVIMERNVLLEDRELANARIEAARSAGVYNSWSAGLVGFFAGGLATTLIFLLAR